MTSRFPASHVLLLALTASALLTGCKKADAPQFSPAPGTYTTAQSVTLSSTSLGATIVYTTDGSAPSCVKQHGTIYSGPIAISADTTLRAMACALLRDESLVSTGTYLIRPPAVAPAFDPAPGAYSGLQHVSLSSGTPGATFRYSTDGQDPTCASGQAYDAPIEIGNSLTLKAVTCGAGYSASPITSGGYDITIPPPPSAWHSIDIDNLAVNPPVHAAGSTSTNENGDAVNISGRGKFESTAQVFRFVYASVTGDFTFSARLDGVDFAGLASSQARVGLLFAPDLTTTGTGFIYGGAMVVGDGTYRRTDRIAVGNSATSNVTVAGTGARYVRITRTGNSYQAAFSLDGGASYVSAASRTITAGLPDTLYVGFAVSSSNNTSISASATFSDVHVLDANGVELIGPDEFTGDIGSGTIGGGTPPPPSGPSHPEDLSRGATPDEPALLAGSVTRYNLEGYAAGVVTGGGNIPDTDPAYRKVTTATELVAALRAANASSAAPVKVIEIMNDLDMGWNEVGTLLQADGLLRQNIAARKHPALIASGVSLLDIMSFNGLTIFSRNGATIRHAEFNIKNGTNLILRNLRFDELWEWDEGTRGDYDSNDWDFVTIGDGGGVTSGIWVDHCTFTKAYDGVLDIKRGASRITVSWSAVVPPATGTGSFIQQQFDDLEANRAGNVMYNLLRGAFTQAQIIAIALPQKKGHLIGSNNLEGLTSYTVTLHHDLYQDLQDRMPRLRGGDVHAYNLYVDSSNARLVKEMRDGIVAGDPVLAAQLESNFHFGVTLNGSISTEGGAVQVESSVFFGVLTPLRNNQTDVTNPVYTGAIRGLDIQHILLASDTQYMPMASQQSTFEDRGHTWASWRGDSGWPGSTLGPAQAPEIPFAWHNGAPTYPMTLDPVPSLQALLTGPQGAGAGKIGMTTAQWLSVTN
ncbi:MAG TPA: chitobiase/beta-hexosaminidase C-terminal domain-containing protein [Steroidobacteraceae bacterium]|nr:chitobiase/beta-hexosaminidase C-terminal domain-containing protein [Steroidobacteraceae bacterium]